MLKKNKKGSALVVALFILAIILISALSITLITVKERLASIGSAGSNRAYQASETGIESVMQEIIKGNHEYINSGTNSLRDSLQSASFICNASGVLSKEEYSVQFLDSTPEQIDCDDSSRPVSDIVKIKSVGESSNSKRAVEALVSNKSTKLLMHFNNLSDGDFEDSSYYNYAYNVSNEGSVSVDSSSPVVDGTYYSSFSTSGDYVRIEDANISDDIDFNFTDKDFTIEAWVKFDSLVNYHTIISKGDSTGNDFSGSSFWLYLYDDAGTKKLAFQYYHDGNIDKTIEINWTPDINRWYHVAFERKGTDGHFFIDGQKQAPVGNFSTDIIDSSNHPLIIGSWLQDGSYYLDSQFFGDMDELRVTKGLARYSTDSDFTPWEDVEYVPNI